MRLTNFLSNHARVKVTLHLLRLSHGVHLHDIVSVHIPSEGVVTSLRSHRKRKSGKNATRRVARYFSFCVLVCPLRILAPFPNI